MTPPSGSYSLTGSVLLTAMACSLLGAFNGCTIDLWRMAGSGAWGLQSRFMFAGITAGAAAGVLVVTAARSRSARVSGTSRSWATYATLWMATGLIAFGAAHRLGSGENLVRLSKPIRFDRPNTVQGSFVAKTSGPHHVMIELERNVPFNKLDAFAGGWHDPSDKPIATPPRPTVEWHVSGSQAHENHTGWQATSYSDTVGVNLGNFDAVAGNSYVVTCTVTKPAPWAQVLNPRLEVEISMVAWTNYYVPAFVLFYSFLLCCGVSIGCLAGAWSCRKHGSRATSRS